MRIVFDFAGVLFHWQPLELLQRAAAAARHRRASPPGAWRRTSSRATAATGASSIAARSTCPSWCAASPRAPGLHGRGGAGAWSMPCPANCNPCPTPWRCCGGCSAPAGGCTTCRTCRIPMPTIWSASTPSSAGSKSGVFSARVRQIKPEPRDLRDRRAALPGRSGAAGLHRRRARQRAGRTPARLECAALRGCRRLRSAAARPGVDVSRAPLRPLRHWCLCGLHWRAMSVHSPGHAAAGSRRLRQLRGAASFLLRSSNPCRKASPTHPFRRDSMRQLAIAAALLAAFTGTRPGRQDPGCHQGARPAGVRRQSQPAGLLGRRQPGQLGRPGRGRVQGRGRVGAGRRQQGQVGAAERRAALRRAAVRRGRHALAQHHLDADARRLAGPVSSPAPPTTTARASWSPRSPRSPAPSS